MPDSSLTTAIASITTHLQNLDKPHITGALLGELIRRASPELNLRTLMNVPVGPGALRNFVAQYLQDLLTPDGKQGSDTLYLINSNNFQSKGDDNPDFWQAFVRPHSPQSLRLINNSLVLKNSKESNPETDELLIAAATTAELEQIRADFVNSLGQLGDALPSLSTPYSEWANALQNLGQDHFNAWTQYRPQQIEALFNKRLQALEINANLRISLCEQMRRSHLATKRASSESKAMPTPRSTPTNTTEPDFRTLVQEMIKTLPLTDLRELKFPAGAMYDTMLRQLKK